MHKRYTSFLWALQYVLDYLDWYGDFISRGEKLKRQTLAIVTFDREIILAQRMFDAAQSTRNSPITGDSNDMSAKKVPTVIKLNGHCYFLDLDARNGFAPEVIVKPDDSETVGSIKYKLELDTSEVDAWLEKINSVISRTDLPQKLAGQAFVDPRPFTLVNNGSINITAADVDNDSLAESVKRIVSEQLIAARKPDGALWELFNK